MMDWEDICEAYDEGRVRCKGCGKVSRQTHKCSCGTGKAIVVPEGCLQIMDEKKGRKFLKLVANG